MLNLILALVFLIVYIYPLRWAAMFADAEDTRYSSCFILSIVSTLIQFVVGGLFSGGFWVPMIVSAFISVIVCMKVLKIPSENFFTFCLVLLFLNMLITSVAALVINGVLHSVL